MNIERIKRFIGDQVLSVQRAVTGLGEMLGWDWLVYNPLVYLGFTRAARRNAPPLVGAIKARFPEFRRMIDVGCGVGVFLEQFESAGFEVVGVEYAARLRAKCKSKGLTVYPFDLSQNTPLPRDFPFDFVLSTEVAEHIQPQFADAMVAYLSQLANVVIFTAATPGQGGTGHVNEQPREYWITKFANYGMSVDIESSEVVRAFLSSSGAFSYMHMNLTVFQRENTHVSAI